MSQTEQLLRRMTGSVTAYMDEVGQRPLRLSDYDKAVLSIRDGEFDAFRDLCPRVPDRADDLLIETAGRPGRVGGNMTLMLLSAVERFSPEAYLTACKGAVETGDNWRVQTLVKEAAGRLTAPFPSLAGEVIAYAYTNDRQDIAKDLIAQCTPEQIAAAPPTLLSLTGVRRDFRSALALVEKGAQPREYVEDVLHVFTARGQEWMAERLLKQGLPVEADNYAALYVCLNNRAVNAAKLLLDRGMDLDGYRAWADGLHKEDGYEETMDELSEYWTDLQNAPQQDGPDMGGMSL